MNLLVMDLEKRSKQLVTRFDDEDIVEYIWATDDRLLFSRDEGGRENYGLYGVNRTGGVVDRLAYAGETRAAGINGRFAGIIRRDRSDPTRVLIRAHETVRDRPDVASMDIRTGAYRVVTRNPGQVVEWVLDWNDVVRFGITREGEKFSILYRDAAGDDWSKLVTFDEEGPGWRPLGFAADNQTAYIASNAGRSTTAVFKFNTKTRAIEEMVCGDDTFDVIGDFSGSAIVDEASRAVVGVGYHAEKQRFVYWEPGYAHRQEIIDRSLPGTANRQVETTGGGSRVLVLATSDRDPGVYYLYDENQKRIEQLAVVQPAIEPTELAPVHPVSFRARDGLELHGYLALPLGAEPKNLPLVIHPHGGPYGPRDTWTYNREVQFYANRGFAVLQINYRGSGGYGAAFEKAGYKQWGLAMQNDLSDGVEWAVEQGYADRKRVVISGASYGGYATMAGLTFTPDLYCAGINYVGVTDLVLRADSFRGGEFERWHTLHIGDVDGDRRKLKDTSPVNFADRIRVPLLMGYGKNDPRVPVEHCYEMERALKRAGKEFELLLEENEGHGFRKEEAAIAFFRKVDEFLKKHVPASVP